METKRHWNASQPWPQSRYNCQSALFMPYKRLTTTLHVADAPGAAGQDGGRLERGHLVSALNALLHVLEAHPRLAALMASRPALAPLLACIHPICR